MSLTYIGAINLCVLCVFVVFPIGDSETIQDIPYLYEKSQTGNLPAGDGGGIGGGGGALEGVL